MSGLPRVRGFRWASIDAGIRKRRDLDVGLWVADAPCSAAALLTTNQVRAAPVRITEERIRGGRAQTVLVNAGCANACTGRAGMAAARASTKAIGAALAIDPDLVMPASTGVIGALLPADKIAACARPLVASLSEDGAEGFSRAILTTDRGPKTASVRITIDRKPVTILGIAKGAGMIHPNMATTLGFVATDAAIAPALLKKALAAAADVSFHAISVDGDTSTNDTILAMASGAAGNSAIRSTTGAKKFQEGLRAVLSDLAFQIVSDGEGAEHAVTFEVIGCGTDRDARRIAETIATSPLVKTALFGKDPNWGRIVAAAGRAGVRFDADRIEVHVGKVALVRKGVACGEVAEKAAHAIMKTPRYAIRVRVGQGKGCAAYTTCDLGHEYVRINADYRS